MREKLEKGTVDYLVMLTMKDGSRKPVYTDGEYMTDAFLNTIVYCKRNELSPIKMECLELSQDIDIA